MDVKDKTIGEMTVAEAAEHDAEMFADSRKTFRRYNFHTKEQARLFFTHCVIQTLIYLGIPKNVALDDEELERQLQAKHIKLEHRRHYQTSEDGWRNGIYVYKDDLMVCFISYVMRPSPGELWLPRQNVYFVTTNAKY